MPNHVSNSVTFYGNKKKIKALKDHIDLVTNVEKNTDKKNFFDFFIPMPNDIFKGDLGKAEREKYGDKNWYSWSIDNWGTKWGAYGVELIDSNDTSIQLQFETAWSFAEPVFNKAMDMGYDFEVEYTDECNNFTGYMEFIDGDTIDVWFESPEETPDEWMYLWGNIEEEDEVIND